MDSATLELLDGFISSGSRTDKAATFQAVGYTNAFSIAGLEREAADLRASLSPFAVRLLDVLERKHTLPLVSHLEGGNCSECHLRLPTALAGSVSANVVERCPHCTRVVIAPDRAS